MGPNRLPGTDLEGLDELLEVFSFQEVVTNGG